MGDNHFRRVHHHAGIAHANRHLTAQRLETWTEHVAEGPWALEARDLGQLLVQCAHRQIIDTRHGRAQREHPFAARLDQYLLDDAAAGDQPWALNPCDIRRRRRERRRLVHVITRLRACADQPLVFQVRIRLQHRGVADVELGAHLAHRGHALAGLIDTAPDVLSQLLGDTLVKQQIGHDAALDFTGILFLCETYRHSLEVYGDSCHNSRARALLANARHKLKCENRLLWERACSRIRSVSQ